MRNHLHKHVNLSINDILGIYLDGKAFVFLADDENYDNYLNDLNYDYYGTDVETSPFYMAAPFPGDWHLIIEQQDATEDLNVRIEITTNREE